jgi:hypothetical protein
MKNMNPNDDIHEIAHEELQRMAREELSRPLSGEEMRAAMEALHQGVPATDFFDHLLHHMHHGDL